MDFERENIEDYLKRIPKRNYTKPIIFVVLGIIVLILLSSMFYTVGAESVGVVQRFGEYVSTTKPGLHVKLPIGIERVTKVPVTRILTQEFGFRTAKPGIRTQRVRDTYADESLMLTGDLNVVDVDWIVQYKINDPRAYLFNVRNVEETIRDISEAAMRIIVGDRSVDGVLTVERMEVGDEAMIKMQELLDHYETGIQIVTVKLQDVNPPDPVKPAFNSVNEARQEKDQMINEAMKEYNTIIPKARGDAEKTIKEAEGYAIKRINRAEGEASRFLDLWRQYTKAKDVTRRRIYLETMSEVLPKVKNKYIIDEDEDGVLRLLPLSDGASLGKGGSK